MESVCLSLFEFIKLVVGTLISLLKSLFVLYIICVIVAMLILGVSEYIDEWKYSRENKDSEAGLTFIETIREPVDIIADNPEQLRNALPQTINGEKVDVTVEYLGDPSVMNTTTIHAMLGCGSIGVAQIGDNIWRIVASPYPGDKMVAAYRSGDRSALTEEESLALDKAIEIVRTTRASVNSDMALELGLHDWLCDNITYYDVDFSAARSGDPVLSAVGALLYGQANCQGYTDGFYVLASIAGFKVDRQCYPKHIFNTIYLGGQWYIVDVTHDDAFYRFDDNDVRNSYRMFNAGLDASDDHVWDPSWERHPIVEEGGEYSYFSLMNLGGDHGYTRSFTDLPALSKNLINEYKKKKRTEQYAVVLDQSFTNEEFTAAVNNAAKKAYVKARYTYWNQQIGDNTYILIRFN